MLSAKFSYILEISLQMLSKGRTKLLNNSVDFYGTKDVDARAAPRRPVYETFRADQGLDILIYIRIEKAYTYVGYLGKL